MSAETTSNVVERMKGRGAGADRPRVVFRTDWKRATRRLIVGGLCAVTAASLTFPSAAMAAEVGQCRRQPLRCRSGRRDLELGRRQRHAA